MTHRPCLVCSRPTAGSRCPEHQPAGWSRGTRPMPIGWSSLRARVLAEEPICYVCSQPAIEVDHVVARARGGGEDRANLAGICHVCHKAKTAIEAHRGRRAKQREGGPGQTQSGGMPTVTPRPTRSARVLKPEGPHAAS